MNDIEKIKAKIDRLYDGEVPKHDQQCDFGDGYFRGIATIENFIDSMLEEKSSEDLNKLIQKWDRIDINTVLKVKVKATGKVIDGFYDGRGHFDHFIDHDVFDRYSIDEVELMPDEESSDDLKEEIKNYFEGLWPGTETAEQCNTDLHFTPPAIIRLARHFAEWQKQRDAELIEIAYNDGITIGKTKQKEQLMNDSEEDALLLERAWLTLDGFGHEELAERLRKLKEKIC